MADSRGPDLDLDRYEAYYTAKLWQLLPAIYRVEDSQDGHRGPLAEIVARLGVQAAIVRRSIDRLWEDQSIETCDDWIIAYIGDLLATNLVTRLDARGQRVDVAKTIHYRRRKGTVALLEELATDITGWRARVVELFRRLSRTRHLLDPPIGFPVRGPDPRFPNLPPDPRFPLQHAEGLISTRTHTGAGGFADLRDAHGAALTGTAFDEYFHTADVRRGGRKTGWYNIPRLGVFLWRLKSRLVKQVTPVKDALCKGTFQQYTFDPTGRDIPLFAAIERQVFDQWVSPEPQEVPGPVTSNLLELAFDDLYPASMGIFDPSDPDHKPVGVARDPRGLTTMPWIDPERGRIIWPVAPTSDFLVDYHYGFSSEIGAGPYERPVLPEPDGPPLTSTTIVDPKQTITAGASAEVVLGNSLTYDTVADMATITRVVLHAANQERPLIRPKAATWTLTGVPGAALTLDGIFLSGGCDLVLSGSFEQVTLSCCTLDPGSWDSEKGEWQRAADDDPVLAPRVLAPSRLLIEGRVGTLVIDRCITGPVLTQVAGRVESLTLRDSIVQAADTSPGTRALSLADGDAMLSRCTLLGAARLHRLDASECILHDVVEVADRQHGCVRFSAWTVGSVIPRQYESVKQPKRAFLFAALDFGQPEYAQLVDAAGAAVIEGAEDGSEMGAFCREKNALRERALLLKYQEYLPLGVEPVIIHVT